jgi:putative hemolysin
MEILILGLLILLNGYFALSEIALISSKKSRLEQYRLKGSSGAKTALKMLEKSENFLSAIQVGITLIGIVTGVYGGMNIADDITPFFQKFSLTAQYAAEISIMFTVIFITYVSIVIGELVPKTIGLGNPEKIAIRVAPSINFLSKLFYPFVRLLSISTMLINKLLGIKNNTDQLSEAELKHMIKMASQDGVIEEEQNLIHEKVFYFSDKRAKHIMTHRSEIEWIDLEEENEKTHNDILNAEHSKLLVCSGYIDNFIGFLVVKEYLIEKSIGTFTSLKELLSEPLVIPENTSAQNVLDLLRTKHLHAALVVNEYGSFEGIITLHDIIENLLGAIPDEDEENDPDFFIREDGSMLVNGDAPIETLGQLLNDYVIDFEEIDYSTVAGFVFSTVKNIPKVGDSFFYLDYKFEVVDMDGNRIDKILIQKAEE